MDNKSSFFARSKDILIPTVVIMAICVVVTAALAGTNLLTESKIDAIEDKQQQESMSEVLKADKYEDIDIVSGREYKALDKSGKVIGYIFVTSEKGYGGDVKVMTGIKTDGTVTAVKVLDATSETPGLGQNTGKEDWYKQFSRLSADKEIKVDKNSASKPDNTVRAVTGATISSKAVTKAVNSARERFNEIIKNEEAGKDE